MEQLYDLINYNTVSSRVYYLDSSYHVDFIVSMQYTNLNTNSRRFFYYESNTDNGTNAYIEMRYRLAIRRNNPYNVYNITQKSVYYVLTMMRAVQKWFDPTSGVFVKGEDGVVRVQKSLQARIDGDYRSEWLTIMPHVQMTGTEYMTGISIFVNDDKEPIFLSGMQFFTFVYFLEHFDMSGAAYSILAFMGRPKPVQTPKQQPSGHTPFSFLSAMGAKKREEEK